MSLASQNVRVAVSGAISTAPTGTAAPTTASTALNVAFKDLGYISDDGVTETPDSSSESIKAWQNGAEVRKSTSEASLTYEFTMIETKKETIELYYASTVSGTDGSIVVVPGASGGRKAYVIDVIDDTKLKRIYIPQGEISERGEVTYATAEAIGYKVTVTAYPDSTINGNVKIWFSDLVTS